MWQQIAQFVLNKKQWLLILLLVSTGFMGWQASQVQLSYEFAKAIPTNHPQYLQYKAFQQQFGEDGNLLVIGCQTPHLFEKNVFSAYAALAHQLKTIDGVVDVLSIPTAVTLQKDSNTQRLVALPIFNDTINLFTANKTFFSLPFYKGILYNGSSNAYLMGLRINKEIMVSKKRTAVVQAITNAANNFGKQQGIAMYYSGLPLIRTQFADRIKQEMNWLLAGSLLLFTVILTLFFRSASATALSLAVVIIGVIWALGTMHLLSYKITLLNALIPPLIIIIGIPNCVYFLNKYHVAFIENTKKGMGSLAKKESLIEMLSKMGIVTLFCNIAAAIGFAVFALTESPMLKEFGVIAGINIMVIFVVSFVLMPAVLSYLPPPTAKHTKYINHPWLLQALKKIEYWSLQQRTFIYIVTLMVTGLAIAGMLQLRSEGFMVDDLPKKDKMYTDLKFIEKNFKGIMPLEIVVDTKQKNGLRKNSLQLFERIDSFSQYITSLPEMTRPLSIVEGLKFARQAYYDGDSSNYGLPNAFDISFLSAYLNTKNNGTASANNLSRLLNSFMDSSKQKTRISINVADIGSNRLPDLLARIEKKSYQYFDTSTYRLQFTGTSITFIEGSNFIISGLKESIAYSFLLIMLCMAYLFRSIRILFCALLPNIIPLLVTAGVMGWVGVPLKPSTVLVFSVALGIAIDITIRFLVSYRQEVLSNNTASPQQIIIHTIHSTGVSIIYTSLVLVAGFAIFCCSSFGGTQALGWLISLTLVIATLSNLLLLPALLFSTSSKIKKQ
jgi:uncharacterized protein